jgi:hypothetical protein
MKDISLGTEMLTGGSHVTTRRQRSLLVLSPSASTICIRIVKTIREASTAR